MERFARLCFSWDPSDYRFGKFWVLLQGTLKLDVVESGTEVSP